MGSQHGGDIFKNNYLGNSKGEAVDEVIDD